MDKVSALVRILAVLLLCALGPVGCEFGDGQQDIEQGEQSAAPPPAADTAADDPSPSPTADLVAPPRIPVGERVSGSSSDSNGEMDNFGSSSIWVNGSVGLGIRCLANDANRTGYHCDEIVKDAGALTMYVNPDGTITATGYDFVSPRSGLVYQFQGFKPNTDSASLITENPHLVTSDERRGTFRAYWDTYRAL